MRPASTVALPACRQEAELPRRQQQGMLLCLQRMIVAGGQHHVEVAHKDSSSGSSPCSHDVDIEHLATNQLLAVRRNPVVHS